MSRGLGNRRASEPRYVRFPDLDGRRQSFVDLADKNYTRLERADGWTAEETIVFPGPERVVERRGRLRRRSEIVESTRSATVTLVLAEAHRAASAGPATMNAIEGCAAGRQLAALIAGVLNDLVDELAALSPAEQRGHGAYRQVIRLTVELTALARITEEFGCTDPRGCVDLYEPDAGGRRQEDVEVAEVRAVLIERAEAAARELADDIGDGKGHDADHS